MPPTEDSTPVIPVESLAEEPTRSTDQDGKAEGHFIKGLGVQEAVDEESETREMVIDPLSGVIPVGT